MAILITERTVTHPDGTVCVRVKGGSLQVVLGGVSQGWVFTADKITELLDTLDVMSAHEDVHVKLADSIGQVFMPKFHADDIQLRYAGQDATVDYDEFKRAVRLTLKQIAKQKS
jgi:hypothetical protein